MSYFIIVGQWAELFRQLSKNFQEVCQNCFPRVQKNTLLKQQVWRKKILSLADIEQKIVGFCKRIFSRLVERAFFASIGTLWGESFWKKYVFFSILDIQGKKLRLLWRTFGQVFWNCVFFVSMRTFWGKRVFFGKKILSSLDIGWRTFVCLLRKYRWSY